MTATIAGVLERSIVVCAGSGGVGKTTISAAIALEAARRGRKTIVVTIDPARRLASALGLERLGNVPHRIDAQTFLEAGMDPAPLDAMMLDTKTTFDELVHRYARDRERAETIIANRFYQAVSGALSGTHEYMAMEKLYELHALGEYDLIVIDTPPTRNALDFLEAPRRMTSFLEGRLLRWFLVPAIGGGKGLLKAVNFAAVTFLRAVKRIIGAQVLQDTAEFLANFEGMYEGFKERAQAVFDLLRDPQSAFLIVTTPAEETVEEALFFAEKLNENQLNFAGLIVNRIHPRFDGAGISPTGSEVLDRLASAAADFITVSDREEKALLMLEKEVSSEQWVRVPLVDREVTDLSGLSEIAHRIFEARDERQGLARTPTI